MKDTFCRILSKKSWKKQQKPRRFLSMRCKVQSTQWRWTFYFLERPPRQRLVNLKTQWLTSALTPWALITCEWCQGTRNISSNKRVETQMSMTVLGCVDCPIALETHTHACRHACTHTRTHLKVGDWACADAALFFHPSASECSSCVRGYYCLYCARSQEPLSIHR